MLDRSKRQPLEGNLTGLAAGEGTDPSWVERPPKVPQPFMNGAWRQLAVHGLLITLLIYLVLLLINLEYRG